MNCIVEKDLHQKNKNFILKKLFSLTVDSEIYLVKNSKI